MISRRHTRLTIALLLPLMVLRAMLPAGYMPVGETGTLHIAMCSDGLSPAAANHRGDSSHRNGHQLPADSGGCAFANAAVNAAPPTLSLVVYRIDSDAGPTIDMAVPVSTATIVRVQSARGPPSFSV